MSDERFHAVITGGASGLGRALALHLAGEGWNIAICDLNQQAGEETLERIRQRGGEGRVVEMDVTDLAKWQSLYDSLRADWQHLDLLVNNAGVAGAGEVGQYTIDDWHWIMNVNLWAGIYGCHVMVDWLKENPRGSHIINTASAASFGSLPTMAAYNVTKSGMVALSETLYAELKNSGVGVTVLCPGFFPTNLLKEGRFIREEQRDMGQKGFDKSPINADDVAAAAIRAMRKKKLYVVMPAEARRFWYIKRFMPTRMMNRVAHAFRDGVLRV